MRGARHRDGGRPDRRGGDRKGPHRLRYGRAGGRRLVRLFCGNLGVEVPQLKVLGFGDAHPAARRRPGNLRLGRPLRLPQADGWRLHRRDLGGADDRSRARQFSAVLRLSAGGPAALEEIAVPRRPALGRGVADAAALGARRGDAVRGRCECSTRRPTSSSSIARAPPRPRPSRSSAMSSIAESWGGMIDVMPDAIPVISPVDKVPGFFIATGFSGHGFGIGPGRRAAGRRHGGRRRRPSSTRRRSACRGSPTAPTRNPIRWRAEAEGFGVSGAAAPVQYRRPISARRVRARQARDRGETSSPAINLRIALVKLQKIPR